MTEHSRFPQGLIWQPDGHVSDWVLSALVDGEAEVLPEDAVGHADSCGECATRIGIMASAAFALSEGLKLWSKERAFQEAPFPVRVFWGVGLTIALGGLALMAVRGSEWLEFPHRLLTLWRWSRVLAPWITGRLDALSFALGWLGVLIAVAAGFAVARRTSLSSEQEPLS